MNHYFDKTKSSQRSEDPTPLLTPRLEGEILENSRLQLTSLEYQIRSRTTESPQSAVPTIQRRIIESYAVGSSADEIDKTDYDRYMSWKDKHPPIEEKSRFIAQVLPKPTVN